MLERVGELAREMEACSDDRGAAGPVRVPPSRQKINCGYPGCKYNGQKRSFKRHNEVKHGGQPVVFQNSAFGQGGRWRNWVVSNVDEVEKNTDCNDPSPSTGAGPHLSNEGELPTYLDFNK